MGLENLHVKPLLGFVAPENGLYITKADIERAKADLEKNGLPPRAEQRPTPFDLESVKKPPSQYIHT